jgi:hypothetical protein
MHPSAPPGVLLLRRYCKDLGTVPRTLCGLQIESQNCSCGEKSTNSGFNYLEEDEKKREARKEVGCFCCGEGGRKISRSAWIR